MLFQKKKQKTHELKFSVWNAWQWCLVKTRYSLSVSFFPLSRSSKVLTLLVDTPVLGGVSLELSPGSDTGYELVGLLFKLCPFVALSRTSVSPPRGVRGTLPFPRFKAF